jgi:hypothetical protein
LVLSRSAEQIFSIAQNSPRSEPGPLIFMQLPATWFVAMHPVEFRILSDSRYLIANDLARGGSIAIRSGSTTTLNVHN